MFIVASSEVVIQVMVKLCHWELNDLRTPGELILSVVVVVPIYPRRLRIILKSTSAVSA